LIKLTFVWLFLGFSRLDYWLAFNWDGNLLLGKSG